MASWSQTFSVNNKYSLTLECSEQSYSVANNTSVVAYKLTMATAANSFVGYSDYRTTISVSINGSSVYSYNASRDFNPSAASSYSEVLTSGTVTVSHNNDGSKTCACAASVTVASGPYSPGSASISQNLTLTTIPRASTASWSGDFVIGTAKSITITRASSSFTHKLTFALGSRTETPTSSAGTSYTWTPAAANWAAQFPTQTSRTGTLTLYTYNGSTLIGSNAYTFTLKIPDSWKPSVSLSLSPYSTNAFISGTGLYVAGYSAIQAAATATAATGAAIISYTFSGAFSKTVQTSATSTTQTSGVIATSGSKSVTVTVTDARGRTGTATVTCSYTSYAFPAVSALSYARGTYSGGTWTASDSGEDLKIVFSATCSLSSQGNSMTYSVPAMSATGSNTSGESVTLYRAGIGTVTAYTVTVTVTDSVGNSSSRSVFVPTVEIPFVLDPTLPAVGVGAVPQTARTLELASNWKINPGIGMTIKSINSAPTDNTPCQYGFTVTGAFTIDGVTIPAYSKGVVTCSGNDVSMYAIGHNRDLYIAFRNGYPGTWTAHFIGDKGGTYTPSFSWSNGATPAPTVNLNQAYYQVSCGCCTVLVTFQITALGGAGSNFLRISVPVSMASNVVGGALGQMYGQTANNYVVMPAPPSQLQVINGAGGAYLGSVLQTGWYRVGVTYPVIM